MIVETDAGKALPLILALHRQWRMSRRGSARLSGSLWYMAGRPTPRERRTILAHLRRVPGLVVVKERRSLAARYDLVKGPLWDNPPPDPALHEGFGELDWNMEIEVRPFPTQSVPEFAELARRALNELFEGERPNRGSLYSRPRLVWPPHAVLKRYPAEEGLRALIRRYGWDIL
jgi:hypothetical protein